MRGRTPLIFAVLVAVAGGRATWAASGSDAARCVAAGLASVGAGSPDLASYLNQILIHPMDPDLPEKLNVGNAALREKLASSTMTDIEIGRTGASVSLKDKNGQTTEVPVTLAGKMDDPSKFDLSYADNGAAFVARYPKWNEIFRVADSEKDGPIYRGMYLAPADLEAIAKEGLLLDKSRFGVMYFAGYRKLPTDPLAALHFAFKHGSGYVPVIIEATPGRSGVASEAGYYDGPELFFRTMSHDLPLDQIDHIWVFDKNRPSSENPFVDILPRFKALNARP